MRQIFLIVVFVLAARWLVKTMRAAQMQAAGRGAARPGTARRAGAAASAGGDARAPRETRQLAEPMVRCAACGVHAPKSDSVFSAAQYFCSIEHARRHAARAGGRDGR
jgi:uncharacterized protein